MSFVPQPDETLLEAALGYAHDQRWAVFPVKERGKTPIVATGFKAATTDPKQITAWWTAHPQANIGWAVPDGYVVVDIDGETDVELPPTLTQKTARGAHHIYTTDKPIKQAQGLVENVDLRTGSSGYILLAPSVHPTGAVYEWEDGRAPQPAPAWLYGAVAPSGERTFTVHDSYAEPEEGWHEASIVSYAGHLRRGGNTESEIYAILSTIRATHHDGRAYGERDGDGGCEHGKGAFHRIAHSVARYEPAAVPGLPPPSAGLEGMNAAQLMALDLPPLRQAFEGLLPEGLGILASPPKIGKSLLCYQIAVELTVGDELLGKKGERRPVLYYALEDGLRRSQTRILAALNGREVSTSLDLRWEAPRLGGVLEAEIDAWLSEHVSGVVIVDVLAKVRPISEGKVNAYNEDYSILAGIHAVAKRHADGAAILIVTHDRKAGSSDFVTRITGTRGVTGVADFLIFIDRKRKALKGYINVTGRDLGDLDIPVNFTGAGWQLGEEEEEKPATMSETRQKIYDYVLASGPVGLNAITDATHLTYDVVKHRCADLVESGEIKKTAEGYSVEEALF